MSALDIRRPQRALAAALETTLAAGGWTLVPAVLGMLAGPLLLRITGNAAIAYGGLTLATIFLMFWAMLAGARLIGLCANAAAQRLPHWRRQAWWQGLAALLMVVLLPAMLQTVDSPISYPLAVAALGLGVALGLFWASMPPWMAFALIAVGAAARWLPGDVDGATLRAWLGSAASLGGAALALLAASAVCWTWMGSRRGPPGQWSAPLGLAFAQGMPLHFQQAQQTQYASPLFALDTPVGSDLHRVPQQALGIALGPGFGRNTFKSALATLGPLVAVALLWLLLNAGPGSKIHVDLLFAPLMVLSVAFAPMMRLLTLFWRPALGLHELALLPGLPRHPAQSLSEQLVRQMLQRGLPALAVMAAYGLAAGAPFPYYLLLAWTWAGSLFLMAGSTLLALHSRIGRWTCAAIVVLLAIAVIASMMLGLRKAGMPTWLYPAWGAAMIAGVTLHGLALRRLKALPHPWLQN